MRNRDDFCLLVRVCYGRYRMIRKNRINEFARGPYVRLNYCKCDLTGWSFSANISKLKKRSIFKSSCLGRTSIVVNRIVTVWVKCEKRKSDYLQRYRKRCWHRIWGSNSEILLVKISLYKHASDVDVVKKIKNGTINRIKFSY